VFFVLAFPQTKKAKVFIAKGSSSRLRFFFAFFFLVVASCELLSHKAKAPPRVVVRYQCLLPLLLQSDGGRRARRHTAPSGRWCHGTTKY